MIYSFERFSNGAKFGYNLLDSPTTDDGMLLDYDNQAKFEEEGARALVRADDGQGAWFILVAVAMYKQPPQALNDAQRDHIGRFLAVQNTKANTAQ